MSTLSNPVRRTDTIEDLLWIWLTAGVVACLLFPALRGHDPLLGWLPFWLIAAPFVDLCFLNRQRLTAAVRAFLVRRTHRRRPARQARRLCRDQSLIPSRLRSMRRKNSSMMRRYKSSPR